MEYGQIFHVTRNGKYYCKNMKYRIIYLISRVRVEYVIVKARQRGNYAANSPSPRALARGRGLSQHNFRGNPLL